MRGGRKNKRYDVSTRIWLASGMLGGYNQKYLEKPLKKGKSRVKRNRTGPGAVE